MKLLFINHHRRSKTDLRAGIIAKSLASRGHQIDLICISEHNRLRIEESNVDGVNYIETPDALFGRHRSGWDPWCAITRALWLRRRSEYDLIHMFETRPATIYPIKMLLRKERVPLVIDWIDWWGRGGLISEQRPLWYRLLFEKLETYYEEHFRSMADSSTVISHALAKRAVSLNINPDSIFRVPNGASIEAFHAVPKERFRDKYKLPQEAFILGFPALDVMIDADLIFHATKRVTDAHPEVVLIMTGNKKDEMSKLAERAGIGENIKHFGRLPRVEDVAEILSCSDVFLLPFRDKVANRGRWPNKIGDFMAMGRPTITNPVGEMQILFGEEEIGLLAEETAESLASRIMELIDNEALRQKLGRNARRVAESRFSWNCIVDEVEKAYKQAIQRWTRSKCEHPLSDNRSAS